MEFHHQEGRLSVQTEAGEEIGYIIYKPATQLQDVVVVTSTFVKEPYRNQGIAGKLLDEFVDIMADQSKKIDPRCSYVELMFQNFPDKYDHVNVMKS